MFKPTPVKPVVYEFVFRTKNVLKDRFEACLNRIPPFSAFFSVAFRKAFVLTGMLVMSLTSVILLQTPSTASAANPTLNFQARLESNTGGIAPDGIYNIEFNLYEGGTSGGGGTKVWTEDRLVGGSGGIRVHNGYLTANLGDVTALPGTINWDADLYLTLDVGDTGSCTISTDFDTDCSGDGEMNPRLKLTAVPYAFQSQSSEQLQQAQSSYTGKLQFQTLTGGDQTFELQDQGAAGTYTLLTTNQADTDYIQNQNSSAQATSNFWISGTGIADTLQASTFDTASGTTTLAIGTTNATEIDLNQDVVVAAGKSITFAAGAGNFNQSNSTGTFASGTGNVSLNGDTTVASDKTLTANGSVLFQNATDSASAFDVQTAGGTSLFTIDTSASSIGVVGTFTVDGSVGFAKGTDYSTTGSQDDVDFGDGVLIRLTGASAQTITGIAGGFDGRILTLVNAGSNDATLTDDDTSSTAANRILTGTGADLTLPVDASISLVYDASDSVWRVIGSTSTTGGGGSYVNLQLTTPGSVQTGNFNISGTGIADILQGTTHIYTPHLDTASAGTLAIGTANATTVNIATNNANHTVNVATGTGTQTVTIGSTSGASSLTLQAGTGALTATTGDATGNSGAIYIKTGDSSSGVAGNISIDNGASAAGTPTNVLTDDFEGCSADDMSTWYGLASTTGSNVGATAHSGSCVLAATETGGNGGSWAIVEDFNAIGVSAGELITVDAWVRAASLSQDIWGDIIWSGGGNPDTAIPEVTAVTSGWTKISVTTVVPTGANYMYMTFGSIGGNGSSVTYFDDITVTTDQGTPAINIGGVNAQSINIGHASAEVNLQGDVTATGTLTASGGTISLNANSNYAVNVATGSSTGAVAIGNSANTTTLGSDTIIIGSATVASLIQGASQTTSNTDGATLTLQGSAGNGSGDGGTLVLSGGAAGGSGGSVKGLVSINPASFASLSAQSLGTSQTLTQSWVDDYSTIPVVATADGLTFTVPAPTISTLGRILYVSNAGSTYDFSLTLGGTSITLTLKTNSSATLIWNGNGWTAAGASSSTDLQSAYNNTLTSAGGAELVLNAPGGNADGLTIRNNPTTPITGGILEVQSSIGTNLFSVNNEGTELAANGGVENTDTFSTDWTAYGSGTSVSQSSTSGEYATGRYGVDVSTSGAGVKGVVNNLSGNPVTGSIPYTVSFTGKVSSGTPTITVFYEPDGSTPTYCSDYGSYTTLSTTGWTKITCTITTPATSVTDPNLVITTNDGATRSIYIDNLSFIRNDTTTQPSNVQIGGGLTGGQVTLFTLDRSSTTPLVASNDPTFLGSMYYDTTLGNIQCYESDGWGACGSAPDIIETLTPEYTGAVLNGTGVGTMTADFCGNGGGLAVNTTFCASGEARNYYRWTSPQPTAQSYSIYVTYKLPTTFKEFSAGTTSMTGLVDDTTNAGISYAIYRKASGGGLTSCSADATIVGWDGSSANGTASTWTTGVAGTLSGTTDPASCTSFAAGDSIIFKITVNARSNANAYAENLTFRYTNK